MNYWTTFILLYFTMFYMGEVKGQCPWLYKVPDLMSSCLCATNLAQQLSIQCDLAYFPTVLKAIRLYTTNTSVDLLYINNSTINHLNDYVFDHIEINNLQLSRANISNISSNALTGQTVSLKILNLQDNYLTEIPNESLRTLTNLTSLDLSLNQIQAIRNNVFETLTKLTTLKLSENSLTNIEPKAFNGLENCLKNLNLRATRLKFIPEAIQNLTMLTFLDLSQNSLQELPGPQNQQLFQGLKMLMALNLERNLIQTIGANSFLNVKTTLNSLSLLNNLLSQYPSAAIKHLSDLRVLDIGFNLITEIPNNAFTGNPILTLLALDGNPLLSLSYNAFASLNGSLRGLSLGGRVLHCDCSLKWIFDWIRTKDLQVTSREKNPKFCGTPTRLRNRNFYTIQPDELICSNDDSDHNNNSIGFNIGIGTVENVDDELVILPSSSLITTSIVTTNTPITTTTTTTTTTPKTTTISTTTPITTTTIATSYRTTTSTTTKKPVTTTKFNWKNVTPKRPNLVTVVPSRNRAADAHVITVKNSYIKDNSVVIQWTTDSFNILGFRVIYRLFGDKSFTQGPPLDASEREFKIKNVPSQECFIVCVITLEDIHTSPENVPRDQCKEVRTPNSLIASNLDKITIATSVAICATIVIAVIIFLIATKRRTKKLSKLHKQKFDIKHSVPPIAGMPVNQAYLSTMNGFHSQKDWDQASGYSNQSIQRSRMYNGEQPCSLQDDIPSHFSNKNCSKRSVADGQSQYSFSNYSNRYPSGFSANLATLRPDMRHSQQSLTMQSDRLSRMAQIPQSYTMIPPVKNGRSRPYAQENHNHNHNHHHHHRHGSRYSLTGSSHTLGGNNYCEAADNWTDHDMDIYMTKNTTRGRGGGGGLVPL